MFTELRELTAADNWDAFRLNLSGVTATDAVGLKQLQDLTTALPRVHLFATGGTISNRNGGRLTVDELIKSIPSLTQRVDATGEQFSNVASGAVTMEMWLDLARKINDKLRKDPGLAGVVVTSGTDTLEELAYFLLLTVRDERPCRIVRSEIGECRPIHPVTRRRTETPAHEHHEIPNRCIHQTKNNSCELLTGAVSRKRFPAA